MQLVGRLAMDKTFQTARRRLALRDKGLESFFHGEISREEAQELLLTNPKPGTFLIRYTSHKKSYCTSFIEKIDPATKQARFKHNLFFHLENGAYSAVPPEQVTPKTIVYPDLVSFVDEYQRKGLLKEPIARLSPLNREISTTPADEATVTATEASSGSAA